MGGIDFCAVYGCFDFYSWDVCGYFFECAFLVRGPFRGCRVKICSEVEVRNLEIRWPQMGGLEVKNSGWLLV